MRLRKSTVLSTAYKITIRWRPGVTHDMKVKYQDHLYDIDTIVDPYMRHEALELYCTEEVRGTGNEQSGL